MRRNELDICADILRIARKGGRKTHLVYRANLNFNLLKRYVGKLGESGLLEKEGDYYYTTERGCEFLERYHGLIAPLRTGFGV